MLNPIRPQYRRKFTPDQDGECTVTGSLEWAADLRDDVVSLGYHLLDFLGASANLQMLLAIHPFPEESILQLAYDNMTHIESLLLSEQFEIRSLEETLTFMSAVLRDVRTYEMAWQTLPGDTPAIQRLVELTQRLLRTANVEADVCSRSLTNIVVGLRKYRKEMG